MVGGDEDNKFLRDWTEVYCICRPSIYAGVIPLDFPFVALLWFDRFSCNRFFLSVINRYSSLRLLQQWGTLLQRDLPLIYHNGFDGFTIRCNVLESFLNTLVRLLGIPLHHGCYYRGLRDDDNTDNDDNVNGTEDHVRSDVNNSRKAVFACSAEESAQEGRPREQADERSDIREVDFDLMFGCDGSNSVVR